MILTFPHQYIDLHRPNSVTPWTRVLSEKLRVAQLINILWNPKVHYFVHKRPLLRSALCQMHLIYFFEIHFNIIHSPTSRTPKWSLSFTYFDQCSLWFSLLFHMRRLVLIMFVNLIMYFVNDNIYETPAYALPIGREFHTETCTD
jgi:hypothetical protein